MGAAVSVMGRRCRQWWTVTLLAVLLCGCANSSLLLSYPSRYAKVAANADADPNAALEQLSQGLNGNDKLLYAQESGRIASLGGDVTASIDFYHQAEQSYQQYDWKAVFSLTDISSQVAGSTISDNLIPYRGQAYERVMLHQQQSLNYLWQGKLDDALVEVRLATQAQDQAQKAYADALQSNQAFDGGYVDSDLAELDRAAGNAPDSFINPYVLYSNATLYAAAGKENDALIDVRKALQLQPENPLLQREFVRLSCVVRIDCDQAQQRYGELAPADNKAGQVVVLMESGQISARQTFWLPFSWDGNYQQIAMPYYYQAQVTAPPQVSLGQQPLALTPLVRLDQLAARSLREQYPFILARQTLRAVTKHNSNKWAESAGGDIGSIAMQIFNAVTEQADRRSWLSLPQQGLAWQGAYAAGEHQLNVGSQSATIKVMAGRTTVVWVANSGARTQIHSQLI
ncbi:COG3014 family protein [Ferrimonas lipolytica]|uniref:Uncharacterized protein n=1 Tax=Ferrimonas lipolytica TaxID=2724191 RepID=A0A6H1UGW9_9GAMM|nr:hypothetical protein [Ferrimonas lipolytica]QIZ77850.1 hypothetical protein HER31_13645 [Ferrimonas lipolytica]